MNIQPLNPTISYAPERTDEKSMDESTDQKAVSLTDPTSLNSTSVKVTITDEGRDSYRESLVKLEGFEVQTEEDKEAFLYIQSKNPMLGIGETIKTKLHKEFAKLNSATGAEDWSVGVNNLLTVYANMYGEIAKGYEDGTREIWVYDESAEEGIRKVTKDEELAALDQAFDFCAQLVDAYFKTGKGAGERIQGYIKKLYAALENQKYVNESYQEKEENTNDLYCLLLNSANEIKNQYPIDADDLPFLVNKIFKESVSMSID